MRKRMFLLSFVAMCVLAVGLAPVFAAQFKDVKKDHWAYDLIQWGVNQKLIKGYPDGKFRPSANVTEQQFLAMLVRAYQGQIADETNDARWADPYYNFAKQMNYPTKGADDLKKRKYYITREHVAEILSATQGVNYSGKYAIHYLLANGLATGKDPNNPTIENFGGEEPLTRAQAVAFIKRVLEKGIKDENGNPILMPRPKEPSDPNDLPPLPEPKEEKEANKNPVSPDDPMFAVDPTPEESVDIEWGKTVDCSGEKCVEVDE